MAESAALGRLLLLEDVVRASGALTAADGITISVTHSLAEIAPIWRSLMGEAIDSPGQNPDFVRLWTAALEVPEANQFYVVAAENGVPVALLPLQRRWDRGVRVLSWFPGPHVGCNAPLVDRDRVAAMTPEQRRRLWARMLRDVSGADVVYLKSVPRLLVEGVDLFAELGQSIEAETLFRAAFENFGEADRTQRNKSRRKHDRQQGERLAALGEVGFEVVGNGPEALGIMDVMFRQRAARFREMGVFNPFAVPAIRAFYDSTAESGSGVEVKLHVLRLDGEIVAVRYSVVQGERIFCLISSMSDDPAIQHGSPGKQCLLRVMQTEFDAGFRAFDMGEGLTDEKRHWCNEQLSLRHHYVPVTRRGALTASLHRRWQVTRRLIKSDERLLGWAKTLRGTMSRLSGRSAGGEARDET